MYKLIALDMDGTLLKDDRTISKVNIETLQKVRREGVKVVLTTGRPIQGIKDYLNELRLNGEDDYVIALNGALICKCSDYSIVSSGETLKGKDVKYIYNKVKDLNTYFHAFTDNEDLVNMESKFSEDEEKRINLKVRKVDFLTDIQDEDEILKAVLEEEKEILDKVTSQIPQELFEEYGVLRTVDYMIEFMKKGCNKSTGLKKLSEHLGINRDEIIAMGDASNDKEMIEYAGLGVAMGNAEEDIKSLANFVTKTNEDDGVAYVVEKFIMNNFNKHS